MTWEVVIQTMPGSLHSFRNESECIVLNPGSVVRGSDELRGENVPDGLGALLVLGGFLYMARAAIWRGSLSGPDSSRPVRDTLEPTACDS